MKLIFCGTPQFAVPTLEKLLANNFILDLVLTNPDEPRGRGYETQGSRVKQAAMEAGLEVFQPARLKDPETKEFLSRFRPDALVVVAYGHILPPWMLDLPRLGCVNLHASLLPKYRGAAPIAWALMCGERTTGATTIKMDSGLDTGDVLLQKEIDVRDDDTTETLSQRLSVLGGDLMVETLQRLEQGTLQPRLQDHRLATLAPKLKKEDGRINWSLPAEPVAWRVRGLRPWPGAYTTLRGKTLNIWAATPEPGPAPSTLEPGALVVEGKRLLAACGNHTRLELKELQLEGRKRLSAREFLNGIRIAPGEKLI